MSIDETGKCRQLEEALRRSEEKYRDLFENAEVGIAPTSVDGSRFIAVNKAGAKRLSRDSVGAIFNQFSSWEMV